MSPLGQKTASAARSAGMTSLDKDLSLVRLFIAACYHQWDRLPDLAKTCLSHGATHEELRATMRHLIVSAGYGPSLKAFGVLFDNECLGEPTAGKAGGQPGNAFELVYRDITDKVRKRMDAVDPVLAEYIRTHLYGDVYSSPGLELRQKQLLMVAFLAAYHMPDQLFGHLRAAFRFGNSVETCEAAMRIAFEQAGERVESKAVVEAAVDTLKQAHEYSLRHPEVDLKDGFDQVAVPDSNDIRVPKMPAPHFTPEVLAATFSWEG